MGWVSFDGKKWVIGYHNVNRLFNSFVAEQIQKAEKWLSDFDEKYQDSGNYLKKHQDNIKNDRKQIVNFLSFVTKYGNNIWMGICV